MTKDEEMAFLRKLVEDFIDVWPLDSDRDQGLKSICRYCGATESYWPVFASEKDKKEWKPAEHTKDCAYQRAIEYLERVENEQR